MRKISKVLLAVETIKNLLEGLKAIQSDKDRIIKQQTDFIEQLREQNANLMDRIMSKNFQELQIYKDRKDAVIDELSEMLSPQEDEENAGAIIDNFPIEGQP